MNGNNNINNMENEKEQVKVLELRPDNFYWCNKKIKPVFGSKEQIHLKNEVEKYIAKNELENNKGIIAITIFHNCENTKQSFEYTSISKNLPNVYYNDENRFRCPICKESFKYRNDNK